MSYQVTGLPAGARFDADTLEVIWTPEHDQSGTYYVHVIATDDGDAATEGPSGTGTSKTAEITIPIVVSNANRAPQIDDIHIQEDPAFVAWLKDLTRQGR